MESNGNPFLNDFDEVFPAFFDIISRGYRWPFLPVTLDG